MRVQIVRIGNSQGIRIPKPVLDQVGIEKDVDMRVENNQLILCPVTDARKNWGAAFAAMAQVSDDTLLDSDDMLPNHWDEEEWQW